MERKNAGIDLMRCIMATLVMLYHYTYRYYEMFSNAPVSLKTNLEYGGTIGVAVFFIISAYYSTKSDYTDARRSIIKKYIRLYPAYLVSISIIYLVVNIAGVTPLQVSTKDFFLNILFVARYVGASLVDGAHWYVYFLFIFYIWHILLSKLMIKNKYWPYIVWLIISTLTSKSFWTILGLDDIVLVNSKLGALFTVVFLERYVSYIVVGVMLYFIVNNIGNKYISIIISIIALIRNVIYIPVYVVFIIGVLGMVLYLILANRIKIPNIGVVSWFASISYAFYLIHQNLGYVLFQITNGTTTSQRIIVFFIAIGLSVLLAYIISLIECKARLKIEQFVAYKK